MTQPAKSSPAIGIIFSVPMVFIGFMAGGMIGSLFVVKGDGLAGGATVFLAGVFGMAVGLGAAIFLYRRLTSPQFKTALLIACVASAAITIWIVYGIVNRQPAVGEVPGLHRPSGIAYHPTSRNLFQPG